MEIEAFRIATPTTSQIVLLIIVFLAVVSIFIIASRLLGPAHRQTRVSSGRGWNSFYRIAKLRNLNKQETAVLRGMVVSNAISNPVLIFTSNSILDSCIQRTIRRISLQELKGESKDDLIHFYYRLRNKIMRNRAVRGIQTTRSIPVDAKLRIAVKHYGYFSSVVNRNEEGSLGIVMPIDRSGRRIPWRRKKVQCAYWRENDAAYTFLTRVIAILVTDGVRTLCLKHTDRLIRRQKRLYPRKSLRLPVLFSTLRVYVEDGKKKAVLNSKDSHWGTIIDISVGGLSLETTAPVDKNNYIRIQFDLRDDYRIVSYGKVKRIERDSTRKTWIMHVQFTKIEKKDKNEIFAVLYNYQTI